MAPCGIRVDPPYCTAQHRPSALECSSVFPPAPPSSPGGQSTPAPSPTHPMEQLVIILRPSSCPLRYKLLTSLTTQSCDDFALRILSISAAAILGRFSGLSSPLTSGERIVTSQHSYFNFEVPTQLSILQVTESQVRTLEGG